MVDGAQALVYAPSGNPTEEEVKEGKDVTLQRHLDRRGDISR